MNTLILVTHIILMTLSLILTSSALIGRVIGYDGARRVARYGTRLAFVGGALGVYLLLLNPVLSSCLILTGYLVLVTVLERTVFRLPRTASQL